MCEITGWSPAVGLQAMQARTMRMQVKVSTLGGFLGSVHDSLQRSLEAESWEPVFSYVRALTTSLAVGGD